MAQVESSDGMTMSGFGMSFVCNRFSPLWDLQQLTNAATHQMEPLLFQSIHDNLEGFV